MKKGLSILLSLCMVIGLFAGIQLPTKNAQAAVLADGTYYITANINGKVVCADNYGNDPLIANRDAHGGAWEEFDVVNNSDGTISLKSVYNQKYVCAVADEQNQLLARSTKIEDWEKYTVESLGNNTYALKAKANSKYVQANGNKDNMITADGASVGTWEVFTFTKLSDAPGNSAVAESSQKLSMKQTTTGMQLDWESFQSASSYDVYRASSRYGTYTKIATVSGLTYTDTKPNSDKYANYYKVAPAGATTLSAPASLEIEMFGPNMYVFSPNDDIEQIYTTVNNAYLIQGDVKNGTANPGQQFGDGRYAFAFKTGDYTGMKADFFNISYYMHLLGLGKIPTDVMLKNVHVPAVLSNDNATCNFWMSIENVGISANANDSDEYWQFKWAVSQAAPARRLYVARSTKLNNYDGYGSGGFISDSLFTKNLGSNTQQQYYIRNTKVNGQVHGVNWNMVMQGVQYGSTAAANFQNLQGAAGKGNWNSNGCYTVLDSTDAIREKPFLYFDETEKEYKVFVPAMRKNASGPSWSSSSMGEGAVIDVSKFYIARADKDNAASINAAVAAGYNLILTPGIYYAEKPIEINRANTIVLGLGLATIIPTNTDSAVKIADVGGVSLAGVVLDADSYSKNMLVVGAEGCNKDHSANPTVLQDVFVRIGGVHGGVASTDDAIVINSNHVIGDDFWVWRADHGDGVGWTLNKAGNGVVVNGDYVTLYGLMVEHFQKYDVLWRGEYGKTYFLQNEKCYDPQSQSGWMSHSGTVKGYAAYKVSNYVKNHYAVGLGSYDVFINTNGAEIELENAFEVPNAPGVMLEHMCVVELASGGAWDAYNHIVNGTGNSINSNGYAKETVVSYCNGTSKQIGKTQTGIQPGNDPIADFAVNKAAKTTDNETEVVTFWKNGGTDVTGPELPPGNENPSDPDKDGIGSFRIVGYAPNWYGTGYLNNIDFSQVTHLIYAFAIPTADGTILNLNDNGFMTALVKKAHDNGVKVSIAIGGWSYNDAPLESTFASATNTDAKCQKLANAMLAVVDQYGLDGIDVDWEYPRSNTANQYESLIRYLRQGLDQRGSGKILTAAVAGTTTTGYSKTALSMLDWVNIMAYDGDAGAGHSPYSYAVNSVQTWKNVGLSKEQLVLGVPFYERPNWASYKDIVAKDSANAYKDSTTINGTTVYYNGLNTIAEKTRYACENAGGIMIWEMSQDTTNKELSLLNKIYETANDLLGTTTPDPQPDPDPTVTEVSLNKTTSLTSDLAFAANGSMAPAANGSYADYMIDVKEAGTYAITFSIKGAGDGTAYSKALSVYTGAVGGKTVGTTAALTASVDALWTGSTVKIRRLIDLPAGVQPIRIAAGAAGFTLEKTELSAVPVTAISLNEEQSMTLDAGTFGASTGNGLITADAIEYTTAGNTFDYQVDVKNAGTYTFKVKYGADAASNIQFQIGTVANGTETALGIAAAPATGAWGTYKQTEGITAELSAGKTVLRLTIKGSGANVKDVQIIREKVEIPADPQPPVEEKELPFKDVAKGSWYYDAVKEVYELGIMTGNSAGTLFTPDGVMTRGMIVNVLYRLDGSPKTTYQAGFKDVDARKYYATSVNWAVQNGIVKGYSDNTFRPDEEITREQMVIILYYYAKYLGMDVSKSIDLSEYKDNAKIHSYALAPMKWAVAEGIMSGSSSKQLNPLQTVTRAQAAKMLAEFNHLKVAAGK